MIGSWRRLQSLSTKMRTSFNIYCIYNKKVIPYLRYSKKYDTLPRFASVAQSPILMMKTLKKMRQKYGNKTDDEKNKRLKRENSYFSTTRHPAELSWRIVSVSCSLQETKWKLLKCNYQWLFFIKQHIHQSERFLMTQSKLFITL